MWIVKIALDRPYTFIILALSNERNDIDIMRRRMVLIQALGGGWTIGCQCHLGVSPINARNKQELPRLKELIYSRALK
jgi:hypothetical protein